MKYRKLLIGTITVTGMYAILRLIAKKCTEEDEINDDNPYLYQSSELANTHIARKYLSDYVKHIRDIPEKKQCIYVSTVKPILDRILSFSGLVFLSPLYGAIALAIKIDDPGPVFFTQKRIGKNKAYFMCHKFRSMKMSTPHDVPTHMLSNPETYITRIGGCLRRTSLDELPQIWDIFRGKMSIIGPRPALWNQDDLVKERDKYSANNILPGLTGLAQINGRDELEIHDKARLDGEYVKHIGFMMDIHCFLGTIISVLKHDGVVEGGTGGLSIDNHSVNEIYASSVPALRKDETPTRGIKKVLIVGASSYIGTQVEEWLKAHCDQQEYNVQILDTLKFTPTVATFNNCDVIFHVAGIAHRKETKENVHLYYEVNRDLAVRVAEMAKKAGVKQFIILSSMSVYGIETGVISKDTKPNPKSNYGKSKLEADKIIWKLRDEKFRVAILRPPMVYGKGCKGNYQLLRKLALRTPVFPKIDNKRSMIYIGNLCSFVQDVIDYQREGIFFPQNAEYVNTTDMAKRVILTNGKRVITTKLFNLLIKSIHLAVVNKVFGILVYEMDDGVSTYNFDDSISLTEVQMV